MSAVADQLKICGGCGRERPLVEFRPRVKGGEKRHAHCNRCHARSMNERSAKGRSRDVRAFVSLASREKNYERLVGLCNVMLIRFGGLGGFSKAWVEEMERAKLHPESPARARCLLAYLNMLMMVEQNKPPEPSLNHVSDEELVWQIMLSMMKDQPEVVVMMGEALGWTLTPPPPEPGFQDSIQGGAVTHS